MATVPSSMDSASVVVYAASQSLSVSCWHLLDCNGQTTLEYLLRRLRRVLPYRITLACGAEAAEDYVARLRAIAIKSDIELFISPETGRLGLLTSMATQLQAAALLVYPATAIFPDGGDLFASLLEFHALSNADYTYPSRFPAGILPEVVSSDLLERSNKFGLPSDLTDDILALCQRANQLLSGSEAFKLARFTPPLSFARKLHLMPWRVLVEDYETLAAANAACKACDDASEGSNGDVQGFAINFKMKRLTSVRRDLAFVSEPLGHSHNEPVPVLYSCVNAGYSGGEESFVTLITHLDRHKYRPSVLLPIEGVMADKLRLANIPVVVAHKELSNVTPDVVSCFEQAIQQTQARLIHCNGWPSPGMIPAAYAAGLPVVSHARLFWGPQLPDTVKFSRRVIAISRAVCKDLLRSEVDPRTLCVIHNGIDLEAFHPVNARRNFIRRRAGVPDEWHILLMVARLTESKGQHLLLSALPEIQRHHKVMAVFVGEVYENKAYFERLKRLVRQNGLEKNVLFWGFERDIRALYADADALVLCSEREPLGRCILEALAMGTPVIAPTTGGHTEIVRDSKEAILYEREPRALSAAVCQLLASEQMKHDLVTAGHKRVQRFDISVHVKKIEDLYDRILSGAGDGAPRARAVTPSVH